MYYYLRYRNKKMKISLCQQSVFHKSQAMLNFEAKPWKEERSK